MNERIMLSVVGALALVGSTQAPAQTGASATQASTPGTVNPIPATSLVEGTAADRTPPGHTQVRGTDAADAPSQVTDRMPAAGPGAMRAHRASALIGAEVHTRKGEQLGKVKDLLIAPSGKVTDLVLTANATSSGPGKLEAVPWGAVSGMNSPDHNLVVDKSQLEKLPSSKK